jgi:hypothetical protein
MRKRRNESVVLFITCLLVSSGLAKAQFGRGDSAWATAGADPQRSSWVRSDPKLSRDTIKNPEFRFLWKIKLTDGSEPLKSLTPAILLHRYIGYRGFRDLAFMQVNGSRLVGIDIDLGRVEWNVPSEFPQMAGADSPGTINGIARPTLPAFPGPPRAFGPGRGGPAHSAVGEPGQGAITIAQAGMLARPIVPPGGMPGGPAAAPNTTGAPGTPPMSTGTTPTPTGTTAAPAGTGQSPTVVPGTPPLPGGSNAPGLPGSGGAFPVPPRTPIVIHTLSADGMLHTRFVSNGVEPAPPVAFVPPGCAARGFIVVNTTAYVAIGACNNKPGGVRALDLVSKSVASWDADSEIAGPDGLAFGPDGTAYVATSNGLLSALDPKTLQVKDSYQADQGFITSPVIFQYRTRVLAVAASKDGNLYLLDTKSLGGTDRHTPLYKTADATASTISGTLASWQDAGGRRWILGASSTPSSEKGAIRAWQIQDQNGAPTLAPVWTSAEIAAPSSPIIFNGVVFATANGNALAAVSGKQNSSPAVIHALDGATGKQLWNSGKTITASAHYGSLSGGDSQIFLGTDDGAFYAFGFWIERL